MADIDYTPIYLGLGVGLGAVLAWKFRKAEPLMEIVDAVYHKDEQKLRVHVTNRTPHPVYAKPAVRKIIDNSHKDDTHPIMSFMPASAEARTMYELITECDGPVVVPANSSVDLLFHLDEDPEFKMDDYLHISSECGMHPAEMKGSVVRAMPMNIKETELVAIQAAEKEQEIDSKKILRDVKKQDSPDPALEAHPHLKSLVENIELELKPVHAMILHLLEMEGKTNAALLSETLKIPRSTINKNLKLLHENNLLHRVREGRGFSYLSLSHALKPPAGS